MGCVTLRGDKMAAHDQRSVGSCLSIMFTAQPVTCVVWRGSSQVQGCVAGVDGAQTGWLAQSVDSVGQLSRLAQSAGLETT